jgi:hypothetical protein
MNDKSYSRGFFVLSLFVSDPPTMELLLNEIIQNNKRISMGISLS